MNTDRPDSYQMFEILVRENSQALMAYIRSAIRDPATADDLWQETMLVAWRRLGDFDRTKPFGPWLRGIASRVMLARHRKSSSVVQADEETLEYLQSKFDQIQSLQGDTLHEKLQALRECVEALPERYRDCVHRRFLHGVMPQQLSEELGVALESVKKRLVRAKAKLLQCVERKLDQASETPAVTSTSMVIRS